MTEEEQAQSAAYIKLQCDVRQLIIDTVLMEFQTYSSHLSHQLRMNILHTPEFDSKVKSVIQNQMTR